VIASTRSYPETSVIPLPRSIVSPKPSSRAGTARLTPVSVSFSPWLLLTWGCYKDHNLTASAECSNLWLDYFVCVFVPGAVTTSAPQPTAPTGPTPQMPGIFSNCKKYHLIKDGESCWSIYTEAGITLAQLRKWNSQVEMPRAATFGWATISVLVFERYLASQVKVVGGWEGSCLQPKSAGPPA
jgi:hypothetical protein